MTRNLRKALSLSTLAVGLATVLTTPAPAQDNIRSVTYYTVKPGRVGDFQAEIKEYVAIEAKGGSEDYYSMWMSLTGPRTYALASYHKTWAELDRGPEPKMKEQAADLARIGLRIIDCTESYRRVIDEINPDLSLPDSGKVPTLIRVLTTQVRPDRYPDYIALLKSDILPGIKKSGAENFNVGESRFGAPGSTITSAFGFDNWADIDGTIGLEKGIGKEAYQEFLKKLRPLVISTQSDIYRFQPDLSYLPPTSK